MGYIYCIRNKINGKCYVGQTRQKDVNSRWTGHKGVSSGCVAIKRALDKYGFENFKFFVVVICFDEDTLDLEKFYIKKYDSFGKNGYNLTTGGIDPKYAAEARQKMSIGQKLRKYSAKELERLATMNWIPIHQLTMNGDFVREWQAARVAERGLRILAQNIGCVCLGKIPSAGGFKWRFADEELQIKYPTYDPSTLPESSWLKKVNQYTLDGVFVRTHRSIVEAQRSLGVSRSHISNVCRGEREKALDFKWKYADDDLQKNQSSFFPKKQGRKGKKVHQFSIDGMFIQEWDSQTSAERGLNMASGHIGKVCVGKANSAGGFKWKYASAA